MNLPALRAAIESIDARILDLLKERLDLAAQVSQVKLDQALPLRDPAREDQVLMQLRHLAIERGLDPHEIERLYRTVLEMSVAHQQSYVRNLDDAPLRVAYQGTEGSYSHLTAQRRFAGRTAGALLSGCETFGQVYDAVKSGEADYGLLPIENSTAGSINDTYDLLAHGELKIVGEEYSRVNHCLVGLKGSEVSGIRAVYSHPQAIAQCKEFLSRLSDVKILPDYDTAGAAQRVRDLNDTSVGAIASVEAAKLYGLDVLQSGINSEASNTTRFVLIGREPEPCPPDRTIKTSLVLELAHTPGALIAALNMFGEKRINLVKLESRPIPSRPFEYRFYVDLEGHFAVPPLSTALASLTELGTDVRLLGSYPSGTDPREAEHSK